MRTRFNFNSLFVLCLLLVALLFPAAAFAQVVVSDPANTRIAWNHNGQNINGGGFKLYTDAVGNATAVGVTLSVSPITDGFSAPFPALTPGAHQLEVSAFNVDVESTRSNVLAIRLVVVPDTPTQFRLAKLLRPLGIGRTGDAWVMVTAVLTEDGWQDTYQVKRVKYKRT